jgi:hypothetical protein
MRPLIEFWIQHHGVVDLVPSRSQTNRKPKPVGQQSDFLATRTKSFVASEAFDVLVFVVNFKILCSVAVVVFTQGSKL